VTYKLQFEQLNGMQEKLSFIKSIKRFIYYKGIFGPGEDKGILLKCFAIVKFVI